MTELMRCTEGLRDDFAVILYVIKKCIGVKSIEVTIKKGGANLMKSLPRKPRMGNIDYILSAFFKNI